MEDEADTLGASGVVGVRLTLSTTDWTRKSVEFLPSARRWQPPTVRTGGTDHGVPFTSDLSGREFWTLIQAGYRPLGFVMGTCVYHVGRRNPVRTLGQISRNVELSTQSQALYSARELATDPDAGTKANTLGAAGVVGCAHHREHPRLATTA